MLLDNKTKFASDNKVIELITRYARDGKFDLVTGYFSVAALAELARRLDGTIIYRMILGQLLKDEGEQEPVVDLLSDDLSIDHALRLSPNAQKAIEFIGRNSVQLKTIQSAFCHAKTYIYEDSKEPAFNFKIIGSSNLTASGLGVYDSTSNIELNYAATGNSSDYKELQLWFKDVWEKVANDKVRVSDGTKIDLKQHLIELIKNLYKEYSPLELYYKVLYELFKKDLDKFELDPDFNLQIGHLRSTEIWNALYPFGQKGVVSLIKMMKTYGGAILADAVGLGKTWQALAVMKYFEISEGCESILLCPKKLEQNWSNFLMRRNSRFENDRFNFVIRYHTDLQDDRIDKDGITLREFFQSDKPKLFVIDESHNLRNDKSIRYQYLVEKLLAPNKNVKVLLLSATPINTSLNDVRNQFKLLVKGDDRGFKESLDIHRLESLFRDANKIFKEWRDNSDKKLSTLIGMLKPDFFKLADSVVVARTRELIKEIQPDLKFPIRNSRKGRDNIFITPEKIGAFRSFDDLFNAFPPKLCAYQPANYIVVTEKKEAIEDEQLRDRFLVEMMYILLTKRLESSWMSLKKTVEKILAHHLNALNKLQDYRQKKETLLRDSDMNLEELFEDDDSELNSPELSIGKREIRFTEIDRSGRLDDFEADLKNDIAALENMHLNLAAFEKKVEKETSYNSVDNKLEKLMEIIHKKWKEGHNHGNRKVVVFTAYKDTAFYLYDELRKRKFTNLAVVVGEGSKVWDDEHEHKKFEPILQRFAPYTKLCMEKKWEGFYHDKFLSPLENFERWKQFITSHHPDYLTMLNNPVDILIATDCLSEGQNLQDADMVINYDIHWNPVRVLQRMGRIDRIGSPNLDDGIFGVNFWPSNNIENYIRLKERVEDRMVQMKIAGIEVDRKFSEKLSERLDDEKLEDAAREKMLRQMQISWDEIDKPDKNFGFNDLSLESFRQELFELLKNDKLAFIPNGVFTGFRAVPDLFHSPLPKGIIALLGYPRTPAAIDRHDFQYTEHYLAYACDDGSTFLINQKDILTILRRHKQQNRFVPKAIDQSSEPELDKLKDMLLRWLDGQAGRQSTDDVLKIIQTGKIEPADADDEEKERLDKKFRKENFDLLCWFIVS